MMVIIFIGATFGRASKLTLIFVREIILAYLIHGQI